MSFPRYPAYKDSGVEWLGEVPSAWYVKRIKHTTYLKGRVGWKGLTSEEYLEDGHAYLVTGTDFSRKFINWQDCHFVDLERYEDDPFIQLTNGDLLITKDGTIGKLALVSNLDRPACLNSGIFLVRPKSDYVTDFMYWVLQSNAFKIFCDLSSVGSTIQHLYQNVFEDFAFPVPTVDEQRAVAGFLDYETAKIDALVAEQERLIELLKEKRQAVISHAVTKGLDPSVPMKDSGVEWLGEVPAHWEVRQVRSIVSFLTSGPRGWSERVGEEGSLFVQSGDLTDDLDIAFSQAKRVAVENDAEAARTRLLVGDVVVCITGAKTGNVAVCDEVEEDAYINQHLCLIRPKADVLPRFLGVFLKSDAGQRYFGIAQYGLKQGLSLENVKATPLVVPPVSEQEALVKVVTHASEQLDQLIGEAVLSIELLRERRTALISAAVTGQIDVRGWAPAATAA